MPDDTNLTVDDLQEMIKEETFGKPPEEQDPIQMGEDRTGFGSDGEEEPAEEPQEAVEEPKEPVEEPVEEVVPEPQTLSLEELETMFVKGKVNGEEREYSLRELLNVKQTQDAATQRLAETKELLRTARESEPKVSEPQPAVSDEYLTDEEKQLREVRRELSELRQHQRGFEENALADAEGLHMQKVFDSDGLSREDAAKRLNQIVETFPDTADFARDLFTKNPSSQEDLKRRIATFNTLWALGKQVQMPEVVRRVAQEAKEEGANQAKIDAKRQLADTAPGTVDLRESSREEKLQQLQKNMNDDEFVKFFMEDSVVVKGL